jgi:putative FmdB family regulatory protein
LPLYEYRCRKCGTLSEKIQKFSDPILTKCEKCGGELERPLSSPAIQFKGSGWYVTDYARKSGGDGGEKKAEKPAASESKSEPKKPSDPAPATKSDKAK